MNMSRTLPYRPLEDCKGSNVTRLWYWPSLPMCWYTSWWATHVLCITICRTLVPLTSSYVWPLQLLCFPTIDYQMLLLPWLYLYLANACSTHDILQFFRAAVCFMVWFVLFIMYELNSWDGYKVEVMMGPVFPFGIIKGDDNPLVNFEL